MPDADLTADQYLRRQGERAKAAMLGAADAMTSAAKGKFKAMGSKGANGNGTDDASTGSGGITDSAPFQYVKKHPWYSVGAATAVGFAGALYFNPTRYGRLRSKLKSLEKRLGEQEKKLHQTPAGSDSKAETAAKSSILSSLGTLLVTQGMNAIKPLISAYVEPLMAGRGHPQNGHDPYAEYEAAMAAAARHQHEHAAAAAAAQPQGAAPPRSAGDASI